MGLKFFADHCVPASVIQSMRDAGHEVLRLKEHIPQDSSDPAVISKARELDAILISLNGGFGDDVSAAWLQRHHRPPGEEPSASHF